MIYFRNIVVHQFKRSARQLQTAAKLLSSHDSSSSSSSDSSDSDQENEKIDDQLNKKLSKDSSKKTYPSSTNERLNAILQRVTEVKMFIISTCLYKIVKIFLNILSSTKKL